MKTWLILDTNYLCHRSYHVFGNLTYGDIKTGVIFGVLRDVVAFQDQFATEHIIFCFDYPGRKKREDMLPTYKCSRKKRHKDADEMERQLMGELRKQIRNLERDYLPRLGFRNVFSQEGMEADDLIASLCENLPKDDEAIIIGADSDLYQLLNERIRLYNPRSHKITTLQSFYKQWGVYPYDWPKVKAIAGCLTDDIPGIKGIGEKTAAKFVAGTIKQGSKAQTLIINGLKIWKKNLKLVRLPLPGVEMFKLRKDKVTQEKWEALADELGLNSLKDDPPIPSRLRRKHRGKNITHRKNT